MSELCVRIFTALWITLAASLAVSNVSRAAEAAPDVEGGGLQSQQLYSLYERLCSDVREQSREDAALGCMAWREDKESVADDVTYYVQSLCPELNEACQANIDSGHRSMILELGLAAQCTQSMPDCGKRNGLFVDQTPREFPLPQSCRDIGLTFSAIGLKQVTANEKLASFQMLIANAEGKFETWNLVTSFSGPGTPGFLTELSIAIAQTCDAIRTSSKGAPFFTGTKDLTPTRVPARSAKDLKEFCGAQRCKIEDDLGHTINNTAGIGVRG